MFNRQQFTQKLLLVITIFAMTLSVFSPFSVQAQSGGDGRRQVNTQVRRDGLKRQVNPQSGRVSFIGPESGRAMPAAMALGTSIRPSDPGRALMNRYAPEFGIQNPGRDLSEMKRHQISDGRLSVRYQQTYQGIPVLGGELIVNTNANGDLYSINGEASQNLSLSTQPTISALQAVQTALAEIAKQYQKSPTDFVASTPALWIYDESLLKPSTRPAELVWRMEATPKDNAMPVRELVLVNALQGSISLHFNQIDKEWESSSHASTNNLTQDIFPIATSTDMQVVTATLIPSLSATPVPTDSATSTSDQSTTNGPAVATATTWYVATTGNDGNACTSTGSPCLTINGAIGKAASGDIIDVATGTYTGSGTEVVSINNSFTLSGGWNAGFTMQSGMSTIDGQGSRRGVVNSGTVVIDNFVIQNGSYGGTYDGGAGIANWGGTVTLNKSSVINNLSNGHSTVGGGIYTSGGIIILNNSTVSGNTVYSSLGSYGAGGGIYNNQGSLTLNNSTISNNYAYGNEGGGIYNYNGTLNLNNSTITGNSVFDNHGGGGIYSYGVATINIENTIIASNVGSFGKDCYPSINSKGHNLIGDTSNCGFTPTTGDIINTSANLGQLIGNPGYIPLLSGSPAIDAGNPATCLAKDERSVSRPQGAACDMGAYEYTTPGLAASFGIAGGSNQKTAPLAVFPLPLAIYVLDSMGSPVSGVNVIFTAPGSGASGTFASTNTNTTTVITNNSGVATASIFTANSQLGSYNVSTTVSGLAGSVSFSLSNASWYVAATGNGSGLLCCA